MPFAILILCEPSQLPQAESQIFLPAPVALCTRLDHTHHPLNSESTESYCVPTQSQSCVSCLSASVLGDLPWLPIIMEEWAFIEGKPIYLHLTKLTRPFVLSPRYFFSLTFPHLLLFDSCFSYTLNSRKLPLSPLDTYAPLSFCTEHSSFPSVSGQPLLTLPALA